MTTTPLSTKLLWTGIIIAILAIYSAATYIDPVALGLQPDLSNVTVVTCLSPDGIAPGALARYYDDCGPNFVLRHTPPAIRPSPDTLVNHHPDAPLRLYLTDALHLYLVTAKREQHYICTVPSVPDIADYYPLDHGVFQYCGGYNPDTTHWYSVAYWPPKKVMIITVLFPGTPDHHYAPYSITLDRHNNVYLNSEPLP